MTHFPSTPSSTLWRLALSFFIAGLAACAAPPDREGAAVVPPLEIEQPPEREEISLALPPSTFSGQFAGAEHFLGQFDWMRASATLAAVPDTGLLVDDATYLALLQARIAFLRGNQQQALADLAKLDPAATHPALRYRLFQLQRELSGLSGDYLESARLGDQIIQLAPDSETAALKRGIWRDLLRVDGDTLLRAILNTSDERWRGWLQLAQVGNSDPMPPQNYLTDWLLDYPDHPAAEPLPGGLSHLLGPSATLHRVALLLPLSGRLAPAGKAVRDGYLASYYAARALGRVEHEVLLLDLEDYPSAGSAYQEAVRQGAGLVIGPLSKTAVAELGRLPQRSIPILALNRAGEALPEGSAPLIQLALAPEDEATRIAEVAFGRGARNALVIRPAGVWGAKLEASLRQRWEAMGGRIGDSVTYNSREDYSEAVKSALGLPASEQRARSVRDMLAENVESTSRRRQDVDVIFLLSRNGPEARALKPLLSFHYAGNIPVFATSSIYSGIPDSRDRDLDGINLVEAPWLLGSSPGLRVAIAAGDTGSDNYTRLNALGADAFILQSRFKQLQAGPDVLLWGNTGLLSLDAQSRVHRELQLATFDGGRLRPQ